MILELPSILTNNYLCHGDAHSSGHGEVKGRRALLSPVRLPAVSQLNAKELQGVAETDKEDSDSDTYFYYTELLLAEKNRRGAADRHASTPNVLTTHLKVPYPRRHSDKPSYAPPSVHRQRLVGFTEGTEFVHGFRVSKTY
ncbi:hypothetical protein STCU_10239 [Strigomonas culicis]|uniref:Uncharacterized protein n=1 Tax=Strigomonas culicis TaxID=28005 RepID=S9TIY3_9TRYP|nr:hypothetical protein STCU_10239 [Strigomonas culicis]|eukprot:EPY18032.1 hypothetical protein STCU_10239 [Strigomonas culicis]